MNIAHFVYSLDMGGMERIVVDISKAQRDRGHKVYIFSMTTAEPSFEEEGKEKDIELFKFYKTGGFDLRLFFKIVGLLRSKKINVVHTHNPVANFYGAICARMAFVKAVINTRHGMGNYPYNKKGESIFKFSSLFVNKVVFVCELARKRFVDLKIVSAEKSITIYNGIPQKAFLAMQSQNQGDIKEQLNIIKYKQMVGTVARLEPAKDISNFIKAARLVLDVNRDVFFVVVGDGSEIDCLKSLAEKLKIGKNLLFLGKRMDVARIVSMFDVFVLSSISEGASITLIEAMILKKAIVATKVGGNPELVLDGKTGLLVPSQDAESLSKAVLSLLSDEEKRIAMGNEGCARAKELFDVNTMNMQYESLYEESLR